MSQWELIFLSFVGGALFLMFSGFAARDNNTNIFVGMLIVALVAGFGFALSLSLMTFAGVR